MPNTGDKVEAHQVIAVVEPLVTSVDLTDKRTELYKIEGEIAELEREVKRLTTLGEFAPRVKLEDAKTNLERAKKQKQQILTTGLGRELLRAPIAGIVSDAHILPGQVIQPGQPVVEIVNPSSFRIEAYTYDYVLANRIREASLRSPEEPEKLYPLTLIGLSPRVGENDQARHILFNLKESSLPLMIGMFVDVIASLPSSDKKITIPKNALLKTGQSYSVFILAEPELVMARPVQVGVFFDDKVEIIEGLKGDDRVIENVELLAKALKK
jgi:membrane fusion protein, heavy metal efflux system